MIDPEIEALINEDVDGLISAEDAARLRVLLGENPEAARLRMDLIRMRDALTAAEAEPPASLRSRIHHALADRPAATAGARPAPRGTAAWLAALKASIGGTPMRRRPGLRYALTFLGGLAAGVGVLTISREATQSGRPRDDAWFVGSLASVENAGSFEKLDSATVDEHEIKAIITSERAGRIVRVRLQITSPQEIEIIVALDGASLRPVGVVQGAPGATPFECGRDRVRFRHEGENTYEIVMEAARTDTPRLRISFLSDRLLIERLLLSCRSGPHQ